MKSHLFSAPSLLLATALFLAKVASVSGMGFFNSLMAHIQENAVEEIDRMTDSSGKGIYFSSGGASTGGVNRYAQSERFTAFPGSSSKNDEERIHQRKQLLAKERRTKGYLPPMGVTQSYSSHDEELIERLVELQN